MSKFTIEGTNLRLQIKEMVLLYMKSTIECSVSGDGLAQSEIFRECGLDWGSYENATSSNQQYWVVGLLRDLEKDDLVQKDPTTKKWRLK